MLAVLVELDLHIPAARSLKDKRGVIKRLQSRLRQDLGISIAEVDHQDLWQRSTLGIAIATGNETVGRGVVQDIERIVARAVEVEVLDIHVDVVQTEERGFSLATAGSGPSRDPRIGVDGINLDGFVVDAEVDFAGIAAEGVADTEVDFAGIPVDGASSGTDHHHSATSQDNHRQGNQKGMHP